MRNKMEEIQLLTYMASHTVVCMEKQKATFFLWKEINAIINGI